MPGMVSLTACVCLLSILSAVQCQDPVVAEAPIKSMFHCSRPGMSCMNEATCTSDNGICDCTEGFQGYDCSVNSTMVELEDCQCQNGGICVSDGTAVSCFCPDAYYGEFCEIIRVSQVCSHDSMELTVVPFSNEPGGFSGKIYVYGNPDAECSLSDGTGTGVYTNTISFESCDGAANQTNVDGDVELSFLVLVQYKSIILTENDQQFDFKCVLKASDSNVEVPGSKVSNDQDQNPLDTQEVKGELVPVELSLVHADTGEAVTTPQGVGSKLKLVFELNGGNVYDSFRVEEVVANNALEDPVETLDFVREGCVSPDADGIVTGFSGDQSSRVELPFILFKFLYSAQVSFKVTVKLCKGTGGCNATVRLGLVLSDQGFPRVEAFTMNRRDCEMFDGVGRRRRAVEDNGDFSLEEDEDNAWEKLDSPGVFVWIPGQQGDQSGRLRPIEVPHTLTGSASSVLKPGLCFQNIWFIVCLVAIVMAFTLLGALVAVLCLRRRTTKLDNSPHTYVTTPGGYDNKGFGSTKF